MTPPWGGLDIGTTRTNWVSPCLAFSRTRSSSFWPPTVWFATMSTFLKTGSLLPGCGGDRARGRWSGLPGLLEDAVHRARDAVLVRPADHRGNGGEVEDRRRRGDLPLQREGAPRVGLRARPAPPARDHVVDEHERAQPDDERGQRDEQVPARVLVGVVGHSARHPL